MARQDDGIVDGEVLTGGQPVSEQFADQPNVVVDFGGEDDILNNPLSGLDSVEAAAVQEKVAKAAAEGQALGAAKSGQSEDRMAYALELLAKIAGSMTAQNDRYEATRQKSYNEIAPDSPWNPEGKRDRVKLKRATSLQGITINPLTHTEEEIQLFNQLKPGRYIERRVQVRMTQDGAVDLSWPGAKIDQRIEMYSRFPTLSALLRACVEERAAKEERLRKGVFTDDDAIE